MNDIKTKKDDEINTKINTQMNIFENNNEYDTLSFETIYKNFESTELLLSPFQLKVSPSPSKLTKFKHIMLSYFENNDKNYQKKQKINHFVTDCITLQKWNDLNDLLKNGLVLNLHQHHLLNEQIHNNSQSNKQMLNCLRLILQKEQLYGKLCQYYFFDFHFSINVSKATNILASQFNTEYIPLDIIKNKIQKDSFYGINDKIQYKNLIIRHLGYSEEHIYVAINMHNTLIDLDFSTKLFCQVLHRALNNKKYNYDSIEHSILDQLNLSYKYIERSLNEIDKKFILQIIQKTINKKTIDNNELSNGLIKFMSVVNNYNDNDEDKGNNSEKELIIKDINEVYGTHEKQLTSIIQQQSFEKDVLLTEHNKILSEIESIFKELSGNETLMNNVNIEKINHLIYQIIPETIKQYKNIDVLVRSTLRNIQDKTADQLMTESLTNILETVKHIKNDLEQAKLDNFSLNTRKLKSTF